MVTPAMRYIKEISVSGETWSRESVFSASRPVNQLTLLSEPSQKVTKSIRIQEKKIDGLLILGGMERGYLKMISGENSIPIVYVDFYDNCVNEDSVISNSFYGAYQITNYLFEKGHRRIGFVGTLFASKSITDKYLSTVWR